MDENCHFRIPLTIFLILGFSRVCVAQMVSPAHIPQPKVTAIAELPVNFTCESFGNPLSLCTWEKFGTDNGKPSTLMSYMVGGKNTTSLPGYYFIGDLKSGVCGLHVENISSSDMASWQCTLFAESNVYRGGLDVEVVRKPAPPKFAPEELGNLVDGETFGVSGTALSCYSAYGLPPPTFRWYLDDEIYEGNLFPPNTTKDSDGNTYTFQQLRNEHFTWRENGKKLRCVIIHDMINDDDLRETSMPINVRYKPRADQNSISVYVPELGHPMTNLVYIFNGNPKPRIYWEVDGVRISAGFSSPDRRVEAAVLEELGPSTWRAVLKIRDLKRSDLRKSYVLKTENSIGRQDFEICLTQSATRKGLTCALFINNPSAAPPVPGKPAEPETDDDETRSDNVKASAENNRQTSAVLEKLNQLQYQMQLLREQEAKLHHQLQRMKGYKKIEARSEEDVTVAEDNLTTTIRSESGDFSTDKSRSSRQFRFQRVHGQIPGSVADSTFSRAKESIGIGELELSEVKVESPGLYIRRKTV